MDKSEGDNFKLSDPQPLPMSYREQGLDRRSKGLLSILRRSKGEWMTRSDIGYVRNAAFNRTDIQRMQLLEQRGLIESQIAVVRNRWEYRALPE